MEMMIEENIMPKERLHDLMAEADEIVAITVSSIKIARQRIRRGNRRMQTGPNLK